MPACHSVTHTMRTSSLYRSLRSLISCSVPHLALLSPPSTYLPHLAALTAPHQFLQLFHLLLPTHNAPRHPHATSPSQSTTPSFTPHHPYRPPPPLPHHHQPQLLPSSPPTPQSLSLHPHSTSTISPTHPPLSIPLSPQPSYTSYTLLTPYHPTTSPPYPPPPHTPPPPPTCVCRCHWPLSLVPVPWGMLTAPVRSGGRSWPRLARRESCGC